MGVGKHSVQLFFMGTELYRFEVPIGRNAIFKKNMGKIVEGVRFLSQTNSILLFGPRIAAKFHQNRIEIAAIGGRTDRMTDRRK